METKLCRKCKEVKPITDFHRDKKLKDGRRNACKECAIQRARQSYQENKGRRREDAKKWAQTHREKMNEYNRTWRASRPFYHRAYTLGVSEDELEALWEHQGGKCAACREGISLNDNSAHADHDHSREDPHVRAFLCAQCNLLLGHLEKQSERVEALVIYMKKFATT